MICSPAKEHSTVLVPKKNLAGCMHEIWIIANSFWNKLRNFPDINIKIQQFLNDVVWPFKCTQIFPAKAMSANPGNAEMRFLNNTWNIDHKKYRPTLNKIKGFQKRDMKDFHQI